MNKKKVEHYMSKAMNLLNEEFNNKSIPREFKGYISQFGASIVQSGLMPAVAFFENGDSGAREDRTFIVKAVFKMIEEKDTKNMTFLEYIYKSENKEMLKEEILNATIALKLVLKSFKIGESTN